MQVRFLSKNASEILYSAHVFMHCWASLYLDSKKLIVNVDLDDTHKLIVYMRTSMWLGGSLCPPGLKPGMSHRPLLQWSGVGENP
jgi:hypothetical protein